jgi:hypothetical protein
MANFEQHVNMAVLSTGVVIVPLNASGIFNIQESFIALCLGVLGGVLPDLDSDNSKPIQIAFKIISIFLPLLVLIALADKHYSIVHMIGIWLIASLLLRLTLLKFFVSVTKHRGIFHSIPMGILFAQLTAISFFYLLHFNKTFATLAGFFLFFGFVIHLLLDELVSLNALGIKVKKSFGTAFKFYTTQNLLGSVLLYIFIAFLYFIFPLEKEPFLELFHVFHTIKLYN